MAEYALRHPLVWLVLFPLPPSYRERDQQRHSEGGDTSGDDSEEEAAPRTQGEKTSVEEGVILNVKYSLKAGNALVIYCPRLDTIVELPLKTIVKKIKKLDITPYYRKISESFENNKEHISVNTRRLLKVSLSITDEKIAAAERDVDNKIDNIDENEDHSDEEEEESSSEEEEDNDAEEDEDSSDEEWDDDDTVDFKVDIVSSKGNEIRGFSVQRSKLIQRVVSILKNDYGDIPVLLYKDIDGDEVVIKRDADLRYALKSNNKNQFVFRLQARFPGTVQEDATNNNHQSEDANHAPPRQDVTSSIISTLTNPTLSGSIGGQSVSSVSAVNNDYVRSVAKESVDAPCDNMEDPVDENLQWQKGELVGVGSFGQVFGGVLVKSGRRIAVKEVALSGPQHQTSMDQALAMQVEIKILSSLDHPNIVKYLGAEFTKTHLRIFLDLASDGSVKDHLNEFGSISEQLLRKYMRDILSGLSFLHKNRIIHRDIKPSNLLLDKGTVKLADFGASAHAKLGDNDRTEMHSVIGTAIYMSPEVMRGSEDDNGQGGYGRSTDIWSLGVTFVEMASSRPPYKNAAAAIFAVCVSKQYPKLPSDMSEQAVDFLDRCLVDDPTARADSTELLQHPFCLEEYKMASERPSPSRTLSSSISRIPNLESIRSFVESTRELVLEDDRFGGICDGSDFETESGTNRGMKFSRISSCDESSNSTPPGNVVNHSRGSGSVMTTAERRRSFEAKREDAANCIDEQDLSWGGARRLSLRSESKLDDSSDVSNDATIRRNSRKLSRSVLNIGEAGHQRRGSFESKQEEPESDISEEMTIRRNSFDLNGLYHSGGMNSEDMPSYSHRRKSFQAKQEDELSCEDETIIRRKSVCSSDMDDSDAKRHCDDEGVNGRRNSRRLSFETSLTAEVADDKTVRN